MTKPSDFETVEEEVEFWESHSSAKSWNDMEKVDFEIDLRRNILHPKMLVISDQPPQCPRCRHELENVCIQYAAWDNDHLVIIRDVPAFRCRANGHEYLLEKTLVEVERLLQLENAQKIRPAEMLHVPVFKLGMAA
jgi:hypothetical protein